MNILRSLLAPAAFAAALVLPAGAFAQQTSTVAPPPMGAPAPCGTMSAHGHPHGPNLMATLNLTPAQKAQIKQIHEQFRAAHPCGTAVTPQQRAQLRQQVMSVLTPQQQAQLQAERQQEHGGTPPSSTPQY